MKIKSLLIIVIFAVVFSGCGSPSQQPTATPSATTIPTATMVLTPTLVSASSLNLEDSLIKPGDLPAGFSGAQIRNTPFQMVDGKIPAPDKVFTQEFEKKTEKFLAVLWF